MKQTVYLTDFRDAFHQAGRGNQFTHEGLEILFNWIEELDDSTGEETELDVIALCCDFEESHFSDIAKSYGIDIEGLEDDKALETVRDHIWEYSQYCGTTSEDCIVYMNF